MKTEEIIKKISAELNQARLKWPMYVDDLIHAAAIINEEAGEATQACLDFVYDGGDIQNVKKELIQTAAMCFRTLQNIEKMKPHKHHCSEDSDGL